MADKQREADALAAAHAADLAKMDAEHGAALAEQQKAFQAAAAQQARAQAAAEAARKRKEEEQLASHKRQFAARKAKFEEAHANAWSEATTGITVIELNVESRNRADELIHDLFYDYLIADVEELNVHQLTRTWVRDGNERIWNNQNKLTMVTTDEKLPLVLQRVEAFKLAEPDLVPYDLVTYSVATGGKAYIQWVHDQTSFVRQVAGATRGESGFKSVGALAMDYA